MADYINNVAAADKYTDALTVGPDFAARSAVITVANNPVLMQFAIGKLGDNRWTDEREFFSIPQSFQVGNVIGVRFRNANPGQVARVLAVLSGPDDPAFQSGVPFTGQLSASGTVTPLGTGMQLISEIDLTVTPTFSGFPTDGTYKHLRMEVVARSNAALVRDVLLMSFNFDGAANYIWQENFASGAGVGASDSGGLITAGRLPSISAANAAASNFSSCVVEIPYYTNPLVYKTWLSNGFLSDGDALNTYVNETQNGRYKSLVAISAITLRPNAAPSTFAAGSRAALYGVP